MRKINALDWIALAILVVGGLNWGLVGFFGFDLIAAIFGDMSFVSRLLYALVGLFALYSLFIPGKISQSSMVGGKSMETSA